MTPEERDLYLRACQLWGVKSQIMMVMEECSELTTALAKASRGRASQAEIAGEIADVHIMLDAITEVLGLEGLVKEALPKKLSRLKNMIEHAENHLGTHRPEGDPT